MCVCERAIPGRDVEAAFPEKRAELCGFTGEMLLGGLNE